MAATIGVDVWQQIMDYLDMRSQLRLMQACKYLHANLQVHRATVTKSTYLIESGNILKQSKYADVRTLQVKTFYTYWISTRWTKLASLDIVCQIGNGINYITTLTALTLCAVENSYQNNITLPNLRRLELTDDHFHKLDHLTALTYLKCKSTCVDRFINLPLRELDIENNTFYLSTMSRLTKLTLHNSFPSVIKSIEKLRLIELALIDCYRLVNDQDIPNLNNMTTLTSLTKIDSIANTSELYLRNLCICQCHAHNSDRVQNHRYITCKRIPYRWHKGQFL